MSTKILIAGLMICSLLFIAGCSHAEVSEEQIQNDVTASAPDWNTDAAIDSFNIVRRIPNEEEKTEKVYVKIDGETDLLYSLRYYMLSYFYSKDEGWMLSDIEADNEDLWETKPVAGPDKSLAKLALLNQSVYVNKEDKWEFTEETIQDFQITENDVVLDDLAATMYCTISLENDLVNVTGTASVTYRFDPECITNKEKEPLSKDGWYVTGCTISDDYVYKYKADKAPPLTAEKFIKYLDMNRIHFNCDSYYDQHIWLKSENISDLSLGEVRPTQKGMVGVYGGKFTYKTPLATIFVEYTLNTSCDMDTKEWYYDSIEYESECISFELPKNWSGTYNNGDMGVDLTLTNIKYNGELEAIFSFYPMPGNTSGKSGSFKMTGSYNPQTLEIDLKGSEWIDHPSYYYFVNINGIIKADNSSIVSKSGDLQVFTESDVQRMERTPSVCDELNYLSETQVQELDTAISQIHSKYGVGIVLLFTSTNKDTWDYLCAYDHRCNVKLQYEDHGLFCFNVGINDYRMEYMYGWNGDKLRDYAPSETFIEYFDNDQYAKALQEYVLGANRYLGGVDSDLTFTW